MMDFSGKSGSWLIGKNSRKRISRTVRGGTVYAPTKSATHPATRGDIDIRHFVTRLPLNSVHLVVRDAKDLPVKLIEHPLSIDMRKRLRIRFHGHPQDDRGHTW
jgi:hypothetical protein